MKIIDTLKVSIGFVFILLVGSSFAMHSNFSEKTNPLSDVESSFCKNFFTQLIQSYQEERCEDIQELARRQFVDLQAQYLSHTLLFATLTNDRQQLLGALFFCRENNDTTITIKSLLTENIQDKGLYQQLCLQTILLIKQNFPRIDMIRILEATVPENLKATLENLGFKYKFINLQENNATVITPIFELQISLWKWCNLI